MKNQQGLALVVVLWVVSLLTIMASSFTLTIQREAATVAAVKEKAQALALAEAGLHYAVLMLLNRDTEQRWKTNNSLFVIDFALSKIRVQIADESGKIDINHAEKEQLQKLLARVGVDIEGQDKLSDAILDWRDDNDLHRLNGAEKMQYEEAGLSYTPRNKNFANIEELQMVLGMKSNIYRQLESLISVFGGSAKINPTVASKQLLMTIPDVTEQMVDEYLQQRVENEKNGEPIEPPYWYKGSVKSSQVYMVVSEAMLAQGVTQQIMAVITQKKSKTNKPFETLKWSKDYQLPSLFSSENDARIINKDVKAG